MPKVAIVSFAYSNEDGTVTVVSEDEVYADNHPFVKLKPNLFRDHGDVHVIEQATAAPGEKRNR